MPLSYAFLQVYGHVGGFAVLVVLILFVEFLPWSPGSPHSQNVRLSSFAAPPCSKTSLICLLHCKWSLQCNSLSNVSNFSDYLNDTLPSSLLSPLMNDQMFQPFSFFQMKAFQTHPLPRLLGVPMINTRQKGAWEQCGLWTAEECLRTSLYHQLMDSVSKKLFSHYFMSSACKQQPSSEPAQQKQAGEEQWKGKTRHQE